MPIVEFAGLPFLHLADRAPLKDVAVQVTKLQRTGDMHAVEAQLDRIPGLKALGVHDAIMGRTELPHVPWSPVPDKPLHRTVDYYSSYQLPQFKEEIAKRGATVRPLRELEVIRDTSKRGDAIVVEHMDTKTPSGDRMIQPLVDEGKLVVNPTTLYRNEKDFMAEAWDIAGVPAPKTITRIKTRDDAIRAYDELGRGDVVLKSTRGAHGTLVRMATNQSEVLRMFDKLPNLKRGLIMQRKENIGNSDFRVHYSRDPQSGLILPVAAVERANLGDGFKTNLSGDGVAGVRWIADLTGGDPRLSAEAIDVGRRAGDAMNWDAFAGDVALRDGKDPVMLEADTASMIVDRHFPVPRDQGVMKHMADLALHGDATTVNAARGASLVNGPVPAATFA